MWLTGMIWAFIYEITLRFCPVSVTFNDTLVLLSVQDCLVRGRPQ